MDGRKIKNRSSGTRACQIDTDTMILINLKAMSDSNAAIVQQQGVSPYFFRGRPTEPMIYASGTVTDEAAQRPKRRSIEDMTS